MESERIKPRLLRGFRDHSPEDARKLKNLLSTFASVFELFGFAPLETAVIEDEKILTSNLGADPNKQIYRFTDLERNAVGLRFDLTVSLARFVAMNLNRLAFPFKRYQYGKVWRFDKPKRGRLREFFQFDADIVGAEPFEPEVELISATSLAFDRLGIDDYFFRINDRRYLVTVLNSLGIEEAKFKDIFRVLDKLESQGEDKVFKELTGKLLLQDFDSALEYERMQEVKISEDSAKSLLKKIKEIEPLREFLNDFVLRLEVENVDLKRVQLDASLTRGLDYYTGFVCEIYLRGARELGSVGGGGRYDGLISKFAERNISGVGLSVGVDRLMDALAFSGQEPKAWMRERQGQSSAQVFVTVFDDSLRSESVAIARALRLDGISTEVWLPSGNMNGKTLSRQFKYADKLGIPLAIVLGEDELKRTPKVVQLKDLRTEYAQEGKQIEVALTDLSRKIRELLA